jgi:hypothetical protein
MTVNEALRDGITGHAVDLEQYKAGVVRRLIALLNRSDADIADQLRRALERLPVESFTVERLEVLLGEVRSLNLAAYQQIGRELTAELQRFAETEAVFHGELFASTIPEGLGVSFTRITGPQVFAAAYSQPFRGRLLSEWAQSIEADRMVRIRDAVRLGVVEQQTITQIVQRVRGTRAKGYGDGIIEIDRRNATAVIRTAVSHVAATARDRFYGDNDDLIKALAWTSTLDSRTTPECRVRDGLTYTPVAHKPIGHAVPWLGGPGRLHWACRSVSVPVLKSWREFGIDMDDMDPGTRASMDGQVPADQTYAQWFAKQTAARQDQIVGPTRGALMRKGEMPFDALYTNRGEYLTLDELEVRNASAFKRVGVNLPA